MLEEFFAGNTGIHLSEKNETILRAVGDITAAEAVDRKDCIDSLHLVEFAGNNSPFSSQEIQAIYKRLQNLRSRVLHLCLLNAADIPTLREEAYMAFKPVFEIIKTQLADAGIDDLVQAERAQRSEVHAFDDRTGTQHVIA